MWTNTTASGETASDENDCQSFSDDTNNSFAPIGETDKSPEDIRREKCFPVRQHTKESRIEDRRLGTRDENLRALDAALAVLLKGPAAAESASLGGGQ